MGHHDRRGNAQDTGGQGDALSVVAGRKRHHAGLSLTFVETRQRIERAAKFEGAHALVVLTLEEHLGIELPVQGA
ncbi:hypothetical protein D3C81_1904990 [compost metagenome]